MKTIYTYSNPLYAAFLAAYLHFHFNFTVDWRRVKRHKGTFHYIGMDPDQNEIYVVHRGKSSRIFHNLMCGLETIYKEEMKFVHPSQLYPGAIKEILRGMGNKVKGS